MLAIGSSEIKRRLAMTDCIQAMETMYRNETNFSSEPLRTLTRIDQDSIILTMPSFSRHLSRFAVKIVSEFRNNPNNFSLPVQGGLIVLIDARNSKVLAVLDSPTLTAIRTGAVTGLATKLLSRKNSKILAVVGSGQQAKTQIEATCAVRDISDIRVFSRSLSHAERLATELKSLKASATAHEKRKKALEDADLVILATSSETPVIDWTEVPEGAHLTSIGTLPERRELDIGTVCYSKLYVDLKEGVLKEAGDVIHAIKSGRINENQIVGDLADLLAGRCDGRGNDREVTLFKSVGFGMQDVYASEIIFQILSKDDNFVSTNSVEELEMA